MKSVRRWGVAAVVGVAAVLAAHALRRLDGGPSGGAPSFRQKGPRSAPVTVQLFSDFQCPNCAKAEETLRALLARHPEDVRLLFRHHPLRMHRWAGLAARAAESAGAQGKFWEYHDALFQRQKDWSESQDPKTFFIQYARELGLDADRFLADLDSNRWDEALQKDMAAAKSLNVNATPTFFINDRRLVGDSQLKESGERFIELEKVR